jgi:membrane protease YdiL (CAAX protease family)
MNTSFVPHGATDDVPSKTAVGFELGIIGTLAAGYVLVFAGRPRWLDLVLAAVAVALIAVGRRRSRRIWNAVGPALTRTRRLAFDLPTLALFTAVALLAFAVIATVAGAADDGWSGALARLGNWHLLPALALYLPWALLQQYVFQFYLLGRLLRLMPSAVAVSVMAGAFAAVHYPRWPVMICTLAAGAVWCNFYRQQRELLPIAVSHALLGSTLHYWVFDHDLLRTWIPAMFS